MPFPDVKRVIYKNNPLEKVICQLRFPPILKIESDVPSAFQEALRYEYPLYREKIEYHQELASGLKLQYPQDFINQMAKSAMTKNHELLSEDGIWSLNLTKTFIAISTSRYERWEEFKERFEKVIGIFGALYNPPFYSRIGLRYVDIINRSKLKLTEVPWSELLQPHFLGMLSTEVGPSVKNCESNFEIGLADAESIVKLATSFVIDSGNGEKCYLIDSDFYTPKRLNISEAFTKLDFLHIRASRLLRWIIKDRLHQAMNPLEI